MGGRSDLARPELLDKPAASASLEADLHTQKERAVASLSVVQGSKAEEVRQLWFTRCTVPTASGLAYKLGWLRDEFEADGISVDTLQDNPELRHHHFDHRLPSLIREGGNMPAIAARAQGAPTRLIGLTWIDERQAILVRPDSAIRAPADLKGARLALPTYSDSRNLDQLRGASTDRGMSLHGYKGALAAGGLDFDDVRFIQVEKRDWGRIGAGGEGQGRWALPELIAGEVDAVYVKGAHAVDQARREGAVVGINLDTLPERRFRVNNGTPRPITVHETLLKDNFDLVVRFLYQTLRAADWARSNPDRVLQVLEGETRGSHEAVAEAYTNGFHTALHPSLSDERLALLDQQKTFLWLHGFADRDFDLSQWVDHSPLQAAQQLLADSRAGAPVLEPAE